MAQVNVEFIYNGTKMMIQCKEDDRMEDIIEKFIIKCQKKKDSLFFLYGGEKLDEDLTFMEVAKDIDKNCNLMRIQACDNIDEDTNNSSLIKSKNIICPECQENSRFTMENFKISIYECKNGHKTQNIQLNEFEKTQFINQTKIICDKCKKDKSDTYENKFYLCCTCKINLCPICKNSHDKSHFQIDYEDKDFYCINHSEAYIFYCKDCKKDICTLCEKDHIGHKTITYGSIMPNKEESQKDLKNLKVLIKDIKRNIKNIISKLNNLSENIDIYFKIYNNMINNYDIRKRNYSVLQNINDMRMHNNMFTKSFSEIINDHNLKTKFSDLMEIYNKMSFKENSNDKKNEALEKEDNKIENEEEKNDDKIGDDNYENIKRYNPSDDKYENFKINNIKELTSFTTKYNIKNLMILHDRRILSIQSYSDENEKTLYKICIYDLNNGIICDINYDIVFEREWWSEEPIFIYQMDDDNVVCFSYRKIQIFKIKRKFIEEIDFIDQDKSTKVYKLSNNKFLLRNDINLKIFLYENGKLTDCKKNFSIKECNIGFINLCVINENEIVIYYYKGKLFGDNALLLFYDIKNTKSIKTLKLGKHETGQQIFLANENNLIVERNDKYMLIDPKKKVIIAELKIENTLDNAICLNDKIFLSSDELSIYQYEIKNNKIELIGETEVGNFQIIKYPDNKIMINYEKNISIYGQ